MRKSLAAVPLALLGLALTAQAQASLNAPAAVNFSGGPLGTLSAEGILSGAGTWQSNPEAGNRTTRFDITNAQLILQKTSGLVQFYVLAGAYNFPTLGEPIVSTDTTAQADFGTAPIAYISIVPSSNFSVEIGKLPTLIGLESTWTWENLNIERGLLWNSEPIVNRGVQVNYTVGPLASSLALSDGYYANEYGVLTGLFAYTINSSNTVSVDFYHALHNITPQSNSPVGGTAAGLEAENSDIFDLMYTGTSGPWTLSPYLQYTYSPRSTALGFTNNEHAVGAAVLTNYQFTPTWSLAGRAEYETSSGHPGGSANNNILGFGPGSSAYSLTVTPTYQDKGFFTRVELSYVHLNGTTAGDAFGATGVAANQVRGMIEAGLTF